MDHVKGDVFSLTAASVAAESRLEEMGSSFVALQEHVSHLERYILNHERKGDGVRSSGQHPDAVSVVLGFAGQGMTDGEQLGMAKAVRGAHTEAPLPALSPQ